MKKTTKTLIIAVTAVALLVGAFLLVYFLVPDNKAEDTSSGQLLSDENNSLLSEHEHVHLVSHIPAEIKSMEVENESGKYTLLSETPKIETTASDGTASYMTDATVYTLVGFEDMDLLTGSPDTLANDCASITASKKVNDGSAKADFGFDKPRATVKVEYTDGDKVTVYVGNDADDNKGAYLMLEGDENVYLVDSESVDGFLMGAMDMLSTEIGFSANDDSGNVFSKMVFGGSLFGEDVVLDYSDYEAFSATYMITSPDSTIANEETVSYMVNNVRNLTAEKVIAVSPDDEKIKSYGLDDPYVTVEAEYPDLTVSYKATKPDDEGMFYLLSGGIVYQMDKNAVPWINYSYDQLIPASVMSPKYVNVNKVTVEADGKTYEFDIERETAVSYNADSDTDVENTVTTVTCGGKTVSEEIFNIYFQNLTSAKRSDMTADMPEGKKELLKITYEFSDGKTGTAVYFEGENRKCAVVVNDTLASTAFESYVAKIIEDTKLVSENKSVDSVY